MVLMENNDDDNEEEEEDTKPTAVMDIEDEIAASPPAVFFSFLFNVWDRI